MIFDYKFENRKKQHILTHKIELHNNKNILLLLIY